MLSARAVRRAISGPWLNRQGRRGGGGDPKEVLSSAGLCLLVPRLASLNRRASHAAYRRVF